MGKLLILPAIVTKDSPVELHHNHETGETTSVRALKTGDLIWAVYIKTGMLWWQCLKPIFTSRNRVECEDVTMNILTAHRQNNQYPHTFKIPR